MGAIRWERGPSGLRCAAGQIEPVRPGEPITVTVLSRALVGVWTHFVLCRRTLPCTGAGPQCCWDHLKTSLRWQGWIAVQRGLGGPVRYLSVTEGCLADYPALLSQDGSLRGRVLQFGRTGPDRNSRMFCRPVTASSVDLRRMHPAPDLRRWLGCLWGPPARWEGAAPDRVPEVIAPDASCFSVGASLEELTAEAVGRD
jgi:hypothetical protein